jgi:glycine/D-amino acid oxidase-like deaminating enzyme
MKLTWGQLFWPTQSPSPRYPPPQSDLECHVLVVGAGLTGALIADSLTRLGHDVILIDKREPGCGSTGASTSLLLYELDTPLVELTTLIGEQAASHVYRLGVDSIRQFAQLAKSLPDDFGFRLRKSLYLCSDQKELPDLTREYHARRRAGLRVDLLGRDDLRSRFAFDRPGAIVSHDAAELDPFRLTQQLLKRATPQGLRVFGHCELKDTIPGDTRVVAKTSAGPTITAARIIYATGYEAAAMIGEQLAQTQVTYAAVSEPVDAFPDWWERALLWETARPYLYLRTTPDNRAMIGGLDDHRHNSVTDKAHLARKSARLKSEFEKLFPRTPFTPHAAWAGIFETTPDGMPYIGPHPRFPRSLFALGYGGNGLTFAMTATQLLQDFCTDKPNPHSTLFAFSRPRTLRSHP